MAESRRAWRKVCKRDSALSLASLRSLEGNLRARAALHCKFVSLARLGACQGCQILEMKVKSS